MLSVFIRLDEADQHPLATSDAEPRPPASKSASRGFDHPHAGIVAGDRMVGQASQQVEVAGLRRRYWKLPTRRWLAGRE